MSVLSSGTGFGLAHRGHGSISGILISSLLNYAVYRSGAQLIFLPEFLSVYALAFSYAYLSVTFGLSETGRHIFKAWQQRAIETRRRCAASSVGVIPSEQFALG